jgi:hypothetical protein
MKKSFLLVALIITLLISCNKTDTYTQTQNQIPVSAYNLQTPGKYIIYELDSLLFTNFGANETVVSYFAMDSVGGQITDNLGRTGYPVFHFIRKNQTDLWQADNTFLTVPTSNDVEFVDDNLRYIKLHAPVQNNYSWKGNAFIATDTRDITVGVTGVADWDLYYLDNWDYIYQNVNQPLTLGSLQLDSTITVTERDDSLGDATVDTAYSEKTYSIEQYAKGIGLVYRNFLHREYQPPPPPYITNGYTVGYGVTLTMLEHN